LKPLYIQGHIDGKPISRMLIDGGAIVNLMSYIVVTAIIWLDQKVGREQDGLKR
jgi:hypothetical protein